MFPRKKIYVCKFQEHNFLLQVHKHNKYKPTTNNGHLPNPKDDHQHVVPMATTLRPNHVNPMATTPRPMSYSKYCLIKYGILHSIRATNILLSIG